MPLGHKDYFELKTFENRHMQEDSFSDLLLSVNKQVLPERGLSCGHCPPGSFISLGEEGCGEIRRRPDLAASSHASPHFPKGPNIFLKVIPCP